MADVILGKNVNPDDKAIQHEQLHAKIGQRLDDLETLHPELQPRKPTPPHKTLLKWIFFLVLVGILLYGIYLFYLHEQGWTINLPFVGVLQ